MFKTKNRKSHNPHTLFLTAYDNERTSANCHFKVRVCKLLHLTVSGIWIINVLTTIVY